MEGLKIVVSSKGKEYRFKIYELGEMELFWQGRTLSVVGTIIKIEDMNKKASDRLIEVLFPKKKFKDYLERFEIKSLRKAEKKRS